MTTTAVVKRVRAMAPAERRFRASCAMRIWRDRLRRRLAEPSWDRSTLADRLSGEIPLCSEAARAIRSGNWQTADDALARHFRTRVSPWPVAAREKDGVVARIRARFPAASSDAAGRADRILLGHYDLLGYRDLRYGPLPDWHLDVVHGRRGPRRFWADVPYLDPQYGDHKITWELNRHQHWLSLGRAFWLDGDTKYGRTFVDQLYSWLDANPPLTGMNWASMLELAFRAMSWTWALEFFAGLDSTTHGERPWRVDLLLALDRQLAHIAENLSRYFSPNTHLSGEALALYVVSLALPELRDSPTRASLGRDVLLSEIPRQILPDGGHAERSTHYHRYSTDFYLLATIVARRAGDEAAGELAAAARAQAHVLRTLADDNGGLPTIGDDDGGQLFAMCGTAPADVRTTLAIAATVLSEPALAVSRPTEEACWVAGSDVVGDRSPFPGNRWTSRALSDSGYFVSRQSAALAIFDAGRHGFLNGGHAHADALAIVTTVAGKPLLIDPGTGTYTMDAALRDRLRSGRLHNTILVDGGEHASVRGPFHWGATTDAKFLFTTVDQQGDIAQGVHDGYGDVRHARTVFAIQDIGWLIVDQFIGRGPHEAEAFWHLHPSWEPHVSGRSILLNHRDGDRAAILSSAALVELIVDGPDAIFAPEYGRVERAPLVRAIEAGIAPLAMATLVATDAALASEATVTIEASAVTSEWDSACVHVAGPHIDIAAFAAAPRQRADDTAEPEWPGIRYGSLQAHTNGRAAIRVRTNDRLWHRVVEGTEVIVDGSEAAGREHLACTVPEGVR